MRFSLAATCKAARAMKVTLMIADFARVANGKLDVIGGGWSMMNAQGPFGFFVAALFQIPWDQTNAKHKFRLELLDADGQGVRFQPARARARRESSKQAAPRASGPEHLSTHRSSFRSAHWCSTRGATSCG